MIPPATRHAHRRPHHRGAGCRRGAPSAASSPCCTSHGGTSTHAIDAADEHAGADAHPDNDPGADAEQRHAEAKAGARRKIVDDERNRVADPLAAWWPETAAPTPRARPSSQSPTCAPAALAQSSTISVSPAAIPSGNGRFSSSMKCLRSGTARNTPSRPDAAQPAERLQPRQMHVEAAARLGGQNVERRQQPAEKRDLRRPSCRRSGRRCSPSGCSSWKTAPAPRSRRTPTPPRCSGRTRTSAPRRDTTRPSPARPAAPRRSNAAKTRGCGKASGDRSMPCRGLYAGGAAGQSLEPSARKPDTPQSPSVR